MDNWKGWNRHIISATPFTGHTRPHKGFNKYGKFSSLSARMWAEATAVEEYRNRVKNQKPYKT